MAGRLVGDHMPLMDWALRSQKSILAHWLEPLRDRDVPWRLGRGHMSLLDTVSNAHVITGSSKAVWTHTAFEPAIHHLLHHVALSLYHGFNCGTAQEFYRSSMLCPAMKCVH
jgi:hypothetical protein